MQMLAVNRNPHNRWHRFDNKPRMNAISEGSVWGFADGLVKSETLTLVSFLAFNSKSTSA
jgi:hypothetical protein